MQSVTSPDGFRHDTGPSLLLFPDKYREAFAALGTSLEEQGIQLRQVAPTAYRVFFESGPSQLDLLTDEDAMAAQMEAQEKGAGEGYRRFLVMARCNLEMGVPYFIDRELGDVVNPRGLQDLLPFLPGLNLPNLLGQHDGRLKQFFRDPRLRALLTFQDLYVGLSPFTAPAVFSLLAGTELTDGVWYPLGGFQTVRNGLRQAAKACGVRIQTGVEVTAVSTDPAGGRVTGVVLADGRQLAADVVVCNRDLAAAYALLDPEGSGSSEGTRSSSAGGTTGSSGTSSSEHQAAAAEVGPTAPYAAAPAAAAYGRQQHERLGRLKYSAGVIAYNWSLSRKVEGLAHHNVFLSQEWQQSWQPASRPEDLLRWPNLYVHCPTRTDPSAAPPGCDSIMVLLPVAHLGQMTGQRGNASSGSSSGRSRSSSSGSSCGSSRSSSSSSGSSSSSASNGADYSSLIEAGRQRILSAFAAAGLGEDVGSAIQHESVIAPPEWEERYGLRHGAAFGLAHGLGQLSLFRPANRDPRIAGLYFVGASTRPGNGVPLCFIGAKLTAERVLKELGMAAAPTSAGAA